MNMDLLPWARCVRGCWTLSPLLFVTAYPQRAFWQNAAFVLQMLVCFCNESAQLRLKISSISDARECELHAACTMVWNHRGREQPRCIEGEAEGVESEKGREGRRLCLQRELSKDNPSTSVKWRSVVQLCCGWRDISVNMQCRGGVGGPCGGLKKHCRGLKTKVIWITHLL